VLIYLGVSGFDCKELFKKLKNVTLIRTDETLKDVKARATTDTGIIHCVQDDDVKQRTAKTLNAVLNSSKEFIFRWV
jgi:hypothetical protein